MRWDADSEAYRGQRLCPPTNECDISAISIYTGREAKFVVPSGVTALTIVADGAQGGGNTRGNYSEPPGLGGEMLRRRAGPPG